MGHITLATLILDSVEFTFDREALWVDDSNDDLYPRRRRTRRLLAGAFDAYPGFASGDVFEYQVFGDNDRAHPSAGSGGGLAGRYKMLIWDTRGTGFDGETGLVKSIIRNTLQQYLAAGGKLWLLGRLNLGATIPDVAILRGDLNYPKELEPGDFAWDFLKLHTTKVNNDKGIDTRNNLYGAPFPGRPRSTTPWGGHGQAVGGTRREGGPVHGRGVRSDLDTRSPGSQERWIPSTSTGLPETRSWTRRRPTTTGWSACAGTIRMRGPRDGSSGSGSRCTISTVRPRRP